MKSLEILPRMDPTGSIQKLIVPEKSAKSFSKYFNKYILVKRTDYVFSINLVYPKLNMNATWCSLDESVLFCEKNINNFPSYDSSKLSSGVTLDQIVPLGITMRTSNVSVSVVFSNVLFLLKWRMQPSKFKRILLGVLKLFVFSSNSIILLKNLNFTQLGINSIIIHGTGHKPRVPCTISSQCNIDLVKLLSLQTYSQLIQLNIPEAIGGLEDQLAFLIKIIQAQKLCRQNRNTKDNIRLPNQVLLIGASGSGKTVLVKAAAAKTKSLLLRLDGLEAINSSPGESEQFLRSKFEEAKLLLEENENGVCILLVKNIECLAGKRNAETPNHTLRCTSQFLNLSDSANNISGLIIIATAEKATDLEPTLRRAGRLETEIYVGVPSEKDRVSILQIYLDQPTLKNKESICKRIAAITPGYLGVDLVLIAKTFQLHLSLTKSTSVLENEEEVIKILTKCVSQHQPSVLKSGLGVITTEPLLLSELGGLDSIKQTLKIYLEWPLLYPHKFRNFDIPPPKGILLYGPPGCAKTSLARALASVTNTTFFSVSAAELYSPYIGTTEKNITELFHRARIGAPSIIFIDEIDALVGKRGDDNEGAHERALSTFLTEMDGVGVRVDAISLKKDCSDSATNVGVVVMAATNRPDKLDAAILRPGRLNKLIYVPPPNQQDRLSILKTVTKEVPLASDVDLELLAGITDLYSGADLVNLVREAGLCGLTKGGMLVEDVKQENFLEALSTVRPSLSPDQIQFYSNFSFCNY